MFMLCVRLFSASRRWFGLLTGPGLLALAAGCLLVGPVRALEHCGCHDVDDTRGQSAGLPDSNLTCPVMPGQPVEDQWSTIYRGKLVRFCCNNCVQSFRHDPEKYLASLPQFSEVDSEALEGTGEAGAANYLTWIARGFMVLLAIAFCFFPWQSAGSITARLIAVLGVGAALYAVQLYRTNQQLRLELVKQYVASEIHRSTYYDYGVPPTPDNPGLQPALSRTFYRGNDERSPLLFNGGNYETAQFDIEIQFQDGTPLRVGDSLRERPLYLAWTIRKPEHAPKRMYDDKIMDKIFLTRSYEPMMGWDEPIADKTPLQTVGEGQWQCRFPLDISMQGTQSFDPQRITEQQLAAIPGIGGQAARWFVRYRDAGYPVDGPEDLRQAGITGRPAEIISASLKQASYAGLVYVCEAFFHKDHPDRQLGARFHYGIKYDLKVREGRVAEGSQLWMNALSRSLKAKKGAIPDDQWLGPNPLPQLPAPQQNLNDKLLGADEYTF
jgi:YHS domain-containing protein